MRGLLRTLYRSVLLAVAGTPLVAAEPAAVPATGGRTLVEALPLAGVRPPTAPRALILARGERVVAIGDSITEQGGWLRMADEVLKRRYPGMALPSIVNKGTGGQRAEHLVERFRSDVVEPGAGTCVISVGVNDVWHRLALPHDEAILREYRRNLAVMADMAAAAHIRVILVAPTLIKEDPDGRGNKLLARYGLTMAEVAREKNVAFVDAGEMFRAALARRPAGFTGAWLTTDGVHLSPRGDALLAIGLLRALGVPDEELAAPLPPPP